MGPDPPIRFHMISPLAEVAKPKKLPVPTNCHSLMSRCSMCQVRPGSPLIQANTSAVEESRNRTSLCPSKSKSPVPRTCTESGTVPGLPVWLVLASYQIEIWPCDGPAPTLRHRRSSRPSASKSPLVTSCKLSSTTPGKVGGTVVAPACPIEILAWVGVPVLRHTISDGEMASGGGGEIWVTDWIQSRYADTFVASNSTLGVLQVWVDDDEVLDRKSTRLNSSHVALSRMPSSA